MSRTLTSRDLAYDAIATTWEDFMSQYDANRRIEVLVDDFLGKDQIAGKSCLDGGCGLGVFTEQVRKFGPAKMTSIDIAPQLVEKLKLRFPDVDARVGDLMGLTPSLGEEKFDVVVSSEVIEHTPEPQQAVRELCRRVKPGGLISISCPSQNWRWLLSLAHLLGVRKPYKGYENWVRPADLTQWIEDEGFEVLRKEGVHTVPWQFLPQSWLRKLDGALRKQNYGVALNIAVLARRK